MKLTGKGSVDGSEYDYALEGSLQNLKESYWAEPPHIAFANLRVEDPKATEAFTKRYGVLDRHCADKEDPDKFSIDSTYIMVKQDMLRDAWTWITAAPNQEVESTSFFVIEGEVEEGFNTDVAVSGGFVHLRPKDLWASICFLFMWDATAHKLGFCGNPDCPAPYFRKKRTTQKYCEQGPCVQYAQRQYSLNWWNSPGGGKERREKRRRKRLAKNQRRGKSNDL